MLCICVCVYNEIVMEIIILTIEEYYTKMNIYIYIVKFVRVCKSSWQREWIYLYTICANDSTKGTISTW